MRGLRVPVLLALILALAGCGISTTGPISFGPAPADVSQAEVVYFIGGDGYSLRPALRQRPGTSTGPRKSPDQAVSDLSAGPTPAELAAGYSSRVPLGLNGYVIVRDPENGALSVTVVVQYTNPAIQGPAVTSLAAEQIACTVLANDLPSADPHTSVTIQDTVYEQPAASSCPVPLRTH